MNSDYSVLIHWTTLEIWEQELYLSSDANSTIDDISNSGERQEVTKNSLNTFSTYLSGLEDSKRYSYSISEQGEDASVSILL